MQPTNQNGMKCMSNGHGAQIGKLKKRIQTLDKSLKGLSEGSANSELLKIINRPGWTTPAELIFALGIVEAMISQTAVLEELQGSLLKGSLAVK